MQTYRPKSDEVVEILVLELCLIQVVATTNSFPTSESQIKIMKRAYKLGRPAKLNRNLEITGMAYENKMTLKEMEDHYGLSRSRLSHIIADNWMEYIKLKNNGQTK